jgi:hypothetical protein
MRKEIMLQVQLQIFGEAEPAANFFALTEQAVREIIAAGANHRPELRVKVKKVVEKGYDDEDEAADAQAATESDTGGPQVISS